MDPRGIRVTRNEYDDNGRLIATIDADGKRIELSHSIDGRVEQVKDQLGNTTTVIYDDAGHTLSATNALGETTSHTFDENGNELTRTDPLGHTIASTFDARGNRLTVTDELGHTTTSAYNGRNALIKQVDAAGRTLIETGYNNLTGSLLSIKDALGSTTNFGYDSGVGSGQTGELAAVTDALNQTSSYIINDNGWRTYETDAHGNVTSFTHDANGRVLTETRTRTDANGQTLTLVTHHIYDAKGRETRTELPGGSFTTTEYSAIDKPTKTCDALNHCTSMEYDARGNLTRTTFADGASQSKTYDANGNVIAQTDREGRTTKFVFDAAGRLTETIAPDTTPATDADNPRTINAYDRAGRLIATSDANGHTTTFGYDDVGRRSTVTDALGRVTTTEYDTTNRRTAVIDAEGHRTEFRYDLAGKLTQTIFADGSSAKTEYDAVGRKTAEIDPTGHRTEFGYDALGRLTQVTLSAGTAAATITRYAYDEQGNRTEQTDAENRTTRFEHDDAGRGSARSLPLNQRETASFDVAGRRTAQTDFNGKTTRFAFDAINRLIAIDYPNDPDVAIEYTASGQRAKVTDGRGVTTYSYDVQDRLLRKTGADGRVIEYSYDLAGNLLSRVTASQSLVYEYDALNRMTSVTSTVGSDAPTVTRYEYDRVGNRTVMLSHDGLRTEYGYDNRNRLRNLVKKTAAGALLFGMAYTVDAAGLRTAVEETDASGVVRTVAYQYDGLKRLTSEAIFARDTSTSRTATWTYDKVGNRLTQTIAPATGAPIATSYSYDANDRLQTETTGATVTTYSYDANGNTLSKSVGGQLVEYSFDEANRLKEMRQGGDRTTYAYDADGLRVAQTSVPASGPMVTTSYLVDTNRAYAHVIEEWTSSNGGAPQLAAVFTFGDDLIAQTRGGVTRFVHADGFGNTRWLTDAAGSITDAISYDAFGNQTARSGATEIEHLYRSEQFDPNLGFYYLRARYLDPNIGRFIQQDSYRGNFADPQSLHKYTYAQDNPVLYSDPSGHFVLLGLNLDGAITAGIRATIANVARVTANRIAGKALEKFVEGQLQRFVTQYGGRLLSQVYFRGPGGVRFADFVVQIGERFVAIEVKTNLPLAGQALLRLAGQIRTFTLGVAPTAGLPGTAAEVIVITEESVAALEAAFPAIEAQVSTGTLAGALQGATELAMALRAILLGI